jgi:nucleotide-binding universal stress UspA family protein
MDTMYQRIFVPVDGSDTSNLGPAEAIKLAKLTGGRLQVLHVIDEMKFALGGEGFGAMYGDIMRSMKEAGQVVLGDARALAEQSGVTVETMLLDSLSGRLSDHVATQVAAWGADLIVLGTHGRRGVRRLVLGSDAEQVVRSATIPVLLVRGPAAEPAAQAQAKR